MSRRTTKRRGRRPHTATPRRTLRLESLEDRVLLASDLGIDSLLDEQLLAPTEDTSYASITVEGVLASPLLLGDTGNVVHVDTQDDLAKPNHSPVFYHDGSWWGVFRAEDDGMWSLWKRNDTSWTRETLKLGAKGSQRPDVVVDPAAGRLFAFFSHSSTPQIFSATYSAGTWAIDPGVDGVFVPGLESNADKSVIALASRWNTPTLFALKYLDATVQVNWSTDNGTTWQPATTTIAGASEGILEGRGLVDATEFSWNDGTGSKNYLAVVYGENSQGQFGFLQLAEGALPGNKANWTHTVLPALSDGAMSDDHVSITRDGSATNNRLFIGVKTEGGGSEAPDHAVFRREADPAGTWTIAEFDGGQSRPSVVYDQTNDDLYFITTNASSGNVEFRKAPASTLIFGPVEVLIDGGGDDFINGGAAHAPVTSQSGLLYVAGNKSTGDIWERHLALDGTTTPPPEPVPGFTVTPTSGLITTETGGTASFTVVLDTQPTADVIIPLSTSNPAEGTLDKNVLAFTSTDWNIAQPVAVTGVDDDVNDGDVAYSVILDPATGAAEYAGLDPEDVMLVNRDDDIAPANIFFALADDTTLGVGNLPVANEDIVAFDGVDFSLLFDGSDVGLADASLDAIDVISASEILFSLKKNNTIPGLGDVGGEDVLKFTATQLGDTTVGTFSMFFDGSDVGLADEEVDAVDLLPDGRLLVSLTGSIDLPGASAKDEDLIAFTPTSTGDDTLGTWALYFDGGDVGLGNGGAEDTDAATVGRDGEILLSTPGVFAVPGITGQDEDIFVFQPISLGAVTAGVYFSVLAFQGSLFGLGANDIKAISVPTAPTGDPPLAQNDLVATNEDVPVTIAVLANDTDPEGAPLTVMGVDAAGTNGSVSINADGTLTYSPNPDFSGTDTFNYTIGDAGGHTDTATVSVTVSPVNDAPSFSLPATPNQTVADNAPLQTLAGFATNISSGPADEAGQTLVFVVATDNDPLFASLPDIDPLSGDLTYTPAPGTAGTAHVSVVLIDGGGTANGGLDTSIAQTFDITVVPTSDPPTAQDDSATTDEDVPITIDVLANDSDPENDPLTVINVDTATTLGSVVIDPAGTLTYTPVPNFSGIDSFAYTVSDPSGGTDVASVTVTIGAVNDLPQLVVPLADITVIVGAIADQVDLSSHFDDVDILTDGDAITFTLAANTGPQLVAANIAGTHLTLDYQPDQIGTATITVRATDSFGEFVEDDFQVTVNPAANGGAGTFLFALKEDGPVGTLTVANEDIVAFDGVDFSLLFDGSDVGLDRAGLDGIDVITADEILISVKKGSDFPGLGKVGGEDIVKFTATQLGETTVGTFSLYFDGSDVGLDDQDVDALDLLPDGRLLVSLKGSATLSGISVKDEDIVAFTPTSLGENTAGSWELYFDGGDVGLSEGGNDEDIDALVVGDAGQIYLSTNHDFFVPGLTGGDDDVFVFTPSSLGASTSGTYALTFAFDGALYGLEPNDLKAIDFSTAIDTSTTTMFESSIAFFSLASPTTTYDTSSFLASSSTETTYSGEDFTSDDDLIDAALRSMSDSKSHRQSKKNKLAKDDAKSRRSKSLDPAVADALFSSVGDNLLGDDFH